MKNTEATTPPNVKNFESLNCDRESGLLTKLTRKDTSHFILT